MGQPITVPTSIGSLAYGKLSIEPRFGAVYTSLIGAATQVAGATTITVLNPSFAAIGMLVYWQDKNMPTNNKRALNLPEPPSTITGVAGNVLTLSSATLVSHYGVQTGQANTSGSRVKIGQAATTGFYYQSETLSSTNNPQSTQLMTGSRIGRQNLLLGQEDVMGNFVTPFGPGWNGQFLGATLGFETETYGTVVTGAGTLAANTAVGATTFTTTSTFAVNDIVQLDATPNRECRKVTVFTSGTPNTVTLDKPLRFAHLSAAAAVKVTSGIYNKPLALSNVLNSLTIEKFIPGDAQFNGTPGTVFPVSFQYSGMYVNKLTLKIGNKSWPEVTADFLGQGEDYVPASVVGSYPTADPYMFQDLAVSVGGSIVNNFSDLELTVDNKLVKEWFFQNSVKVGVIRPGPRMVEGKVVYYFSDYTAFEAFKQNLPVRLTNTWYQESTTLSATIDLTNVHYTSFKEKAPFGGLVVIEAGFVAVQDTSTGVEGTFTLQTYDYLPYTF